MTKKEMEKKIETLEGEIKSLLEIMKLLMNSKQNDIYIEPYPYKDEIWRDKHPYPTIPIKPWYDPTTPVEPWCDPYKITCSTLKEEADKFKTGQKWLSN